MPPLPATILVVEDEPDQMTYISQVLTRAGYRVLPAYGGDDAIRKVQTRHIDLVVTDLAMPRVTGVEVIEAIKSDPATRHLPVVVVTAHVWGGFADNAGTAGADGFIGKPFTPQRLLQEVQKHLKPPVG